MVPPIMRRTPWRRRLVCALAAGACCVGVASCLQAAERTAAQSSAIDLPAELHGRAEELLADRPLDLTGVRELVGLYAKADVRVAEFLADIQSGRVPAEPGEFSQQDLPRAVISDMALAACAKHFVRRRYVPCLAWLDLASVDACSSPELYWYYRAVAHHQLVQSKEAIEAAETLLAIEEPRSRRVHQVARLVLRDAQTHDPGSLTLIARQMGDVRRRLWLGQSGQLNIALQQEVIDALDKIIEKAEEQRKKQQQQQMAQGSIPQGGAMPMEQSRSGDLKGAGEVDDRDIRPGGDWGRLPPAERERVTQQIIRDFPAHYRDVIEDYFRSLSGEPSAEGGDR